MRKSILLLLLAWAPLRAGDDSFRERFADPETRAAALATLIPGTRDAYFHTALDHQLAGRDAEFRKTLAEWKAASSRKDNRVDDEGLAVLENRQLLLGYRADPSPAALIRRLDLTFTDTRPDAAAAGQLLPTAVDPALISDIAFEKAGTTGAENTPTYRRYHGARLHRELAGAAAFDRDTARWFMDHLDRADLPGVMALVERALSFDSTHSFTEHPLLKKLTAGQLEQLLTAHPDLRIKESFAIAWLSRHLPGAETDFTRDPQAHAAHLRFCRDFVLAPGPPVSDSLKAHVLYHHLRLQAALGQFPLDDFLRFLALPRASHPLLAVPKPDARVATIDLSSDFSTATSCLPVPSDVALIRAQLEHHLATTDDASAFTPFIPEKTLADLHARARLLAGADPARWGRALDAAAYRELLDEVRIGFPAGAPAQLAAGAAVSLPLELKNTPDLRIRIFALDLPALLGSGHEPGTDIDLTGMVPHHERHLAFAQPAIQLHRESIDLPELAGPGAWVVEFVSGRTSARALVRKGSLTPCLERTATGQTVRVFDEAGRPVLGAIAKLGRETIAADAGGLITIPDAPDAPLTTGVVVAGTLAAPLELETRQDEIALDSQFHLDDEQLLADQEAKLHLRLRLTNHGREIPLARVQNPALVLSAQLSGGVTIERVIADGLELKPVMEIPFQVPADLTGITLSLRGTVLPATGGEPVKLEARDTRQLNGSVATAVIGGIHFSPTRTGHRLEYRGRNGEPLPSRALVLSFQREGFRASVGVQVRTDEAGRVDLGTLEGITDVESRADGVLSNYAPTPVRKELPPRIHTAAGREIRIPLATTHGILDREGVSLLEYREGVPLRDHFDKIRPDDGVLVLAGLPAGDFVLNQDGRETRILVSSGELRNGLLVSPARILPELVPASPVVQAAAVENGRLNVGLRDFTPETRVTVIGRRFSPGAGAPPTKLFPPALPDIVTPALITCGYLTDQQLDDETRYIFDRRAAKPFAGSMLPRPGLLLNRWTDAVVDQETRQGGTGAGGSSRDGLNRRSTRGAVPSETASRSRPAVSRQSLDFLEFPAAVKFDLTPAEDGTLSLPLADFEGSQYLEITAAGPYAADQRQLPLPPDETRLRDRRIARPLDPQAHHLATRSALALQQGGEATIENLLDADWRAFTTLADAARYFEGATQDDRLREFAFLPEWPDFPEEKKLELLATHACHEFHLFLARKDKAFFEKHVKPMLARKLEPRFIDDLLLGRDLTGYLRPYAWKRLNAAEKALLAQALPASRERIARELSLRWQLEAPGPDAESQLFAQTLRGSDLATSDSLGLAANRQGLIEPLMSDAAEHAPFMPEETLFGVSYLNEKLKRIIIPRIDFEDTTLEEAIDFLRLRTSELDVTELDPSKKGVNFIVRRPRTSTGEDGGLAASTDPGSLRIKELRIRNVPLAVALKYICDQTKLRYKVDDYAVTLVPQTETGEDLFTRVFRVPPDFTSSLESDSNSYEAFDPDPFAEPNRKGAAKLTARKPVLELLKQAGINFSEGSTATLSRDGVLLITNTPSELDKIEQLTQALHSGPSESTAASADPFAPDDLPVPVPLPGDEPSRPVLPFADHTRLWREADYFKSTAATDESLIPLNGFWLDLAAWNGEGPFLSARFNACKTNANEALMCLALLDLPFKAERPEVTVDGGSLRVKAREPMLLFYKDTRRTDNLAAESPLLVRQTFSPLDEPFRTVDGQQVENPVTGDFRPGTAYQMSLVVTNPTGLGRRIDLLAQIPAGAIPLKGGPMTASLARDLPPHGVVTSDLAFYFPEAGAFPVYPLHVSEKGRVLAHTAPRVLGVSTRPAPVDAASWSVLAGEGTNDQVLERLRTGNLATLDLAAIRWRLHDAAFFQQVGSLLRERLFFSPQVAAYGFLHNDLPAMRDFLENQDIAVQLGDWLDSPMLEIRPRVHHGWRTLEFDPLVNARAHAFGGESRLTHEAAREHYQAFLDQLAWKPALDATDQLTLAAFLFLQDRIEDGLARFAKIDPSKLPSRLHYDYLHAVVLFLQEKPEDAKVIAIQALPTVPPGLWRDRFQAVIQQADEIASLRQPRSEQKPVAETPALDLALAADGRLAVRHRGVERTTLRFYGVDLEVMFSKNPFLKSAPDSGAQPAILANASLEVPLPAGESETTVALPASLGKGSLLVAAESGDTRRMAVLDSQRLELRVNPPTRTVQVLDTATARPLPKSYVKVYAEMSDGSVVFHKDGYTDLRGKFDYLSHTAVDPAAVRRLAILVSHPENGTRTVICDR